MAPNPATKPEAPLPESERGRLWQPPEKRGKTSEAGRQWQRENAAAAAEWKAWVEKHGTPLPPLF